MMRFGIPTFRLPRDILDAEIARLLDDWDHAASSTPESTTCDAAHARAAGSTRPSSRSARS